MGAAFSNEASNIRPYIVDEFLKAHPVDGKITARQLIELKQLDSMRVDMGHLCLLWCCDTDKDGLYTLSDLFNVAAFFTEAQSLFNVKTEAMAPYLQ
ncbi:hypothetical protein KIPB_009209, partial [Kipferlia bialata]|eukprot:g9209.t1